MYNKIYYPFCKNCINIYKFTLIYIIMYCYKCKYIMHNKTRYILKYITQYHLNRYNFNPSKYKNEIIILYTKYINPHIS